ncbi:hypothetical protein [Flavobacterium sp.]|uniref:hypothetical protein n=1 Tax=Flavobacterium sp. TaxID=239 RepID=UPI00263685D2|nr:hypothetical protein [Flavobacterium sp.]
MNSFIKNIENKLQIKSNYLLLLAIFNGAILMNFHKLIFSNPLALFVIIGFVLISIINIKYWWATLVNSIISIYFLIDKFPRIGNHSTIILSFSLFLLVVFALKLSSKKTIFNTNLVSYFFRTITVTIYFYTGFHKLNTDFFNPCVSCVNEVNVYALSNFINERFVLPEFWSHFFQYGTLFIELILPFGLLHFKTRKITGFLLLCFHCYLSLSGFADFSCVGLFLILGCLVNFEEKTISKNNLKAVKPFLIFIILAIIIRYYLPTFGIDNYKNTFIEGFIFDIGFVIFIYTFFKSYSAKEYAYAKKFNAYLIPIFVIINLWTLKGYFGLGNAGNLTMFSNLVTEKSTNNHLLIDTKKTKLFDFEEDYVEIIYLKNKNIREDFNGYKLPLVEFNFLVNYWNKTYTDKVPCKLIYKGKIFETNDIRTSEFNQTKWWYKYLSFRKIQSKGPNECRW